MSEATDFAKREAFLRALNAGLETAERLGLTYPSDRACAVRLALKDQGLVLTWAKGSKVAPSQGA